MSVITDQVRRLDAQLDRIPHENVTTQAAELNTSRAKHLERIIKALSASTGSKPLLPKSQLRFLLSQSKLLPARFDAAHLPSQYESDLEWLLVSKATVQTYGVILETLLDQIIPLSDHLWYWDSILSSSTSSSLYMILNAR